MTFFTRENLAVGWYMWLRAWFLLVVGFYLFIFLVAAMVGAFVPGFVQDRQAVRALVVSLVFILGLPMVILILDRCGKTVARHRFNYEVDRFLGWSLFWRVLLWHWLIGTVLWVTGMTVAVLFRALHLRGAVGVGFILILASIAASIVAYGWITKRVVILYGHPAAS